MSTTEEIVRQEQAEHDAAEAAEQGEANAEKGELFDRDAYEAEDLQLPKIDGEPTDKIAIKFSGTVLLDRLDARDVALMRRMKLGQDVTLMVEARCGAKGHKYTTSREGELDAVVLEHNARVHSVYRPAGDGTRPAMELEKDSEEFEEVEA